MGKRKIIDVSESSATPVSESATPVSIRRKKRKFVDLSASSATPVSESASATPVSESASASATPLAIRGKKGKKQKNATPVSESASAIPLAIRGGKKGKKQTNVGSATAGKKGKKQKNVGSATAVTVVQYCDIPADQKKTWVLDSKLDVGFRYTQILEWIRYWCTKDGQCFDGIRSVSGDGYPLIEVEVLHEDRPTKFIIARTSVFILAYYCAEFGWRVFDDSEFQLVGENFRQIRMNANYTNCAAWSSLGPLKMITALDVIRSGVDEIASRGCEVFMVHLSEAARFYILEYIITETLLTIERVPFVPTDEANKKLVEVPFVPTDEANKKLVEENMEGKDISSFLNPIRVNLQSNVTAPKEITKTIKNFGALCKTWYAYDLSRKKILSLKKETALACGVHNIGSLRRSLALLCGTNLKKVIGEWRNKQGKPEYPDFKRKDLKYMEKRVKAFYKARTS